MKYLCLGAALPILLVILIGGAMSDGSSPAQATGSGQALGSLDPSALPAAAGAILPILQSDLASTCPQLPVLWVAAEIQAESGWNPHAYSPVGAAGLLQLMPATWTSAAGGTGWDPTTRPPVDHPVWDPVRHLAVAIPWMCANLRAMRTYLAGTGKPVTPLDAMAVCHIAGCSRVTGSATGIPVAGEAGCGSACADAVHNYLSAIHRWITAYAAPGSSADNGGDSPAEPFTGDSTGCTVPDPTGTGGCITPATAWMLHQVDARFGDWPAGCFRAHDAVATSDHPLGKACDFTVGRLGAFPDATDVAHGTALATWLQANAAALHVSYLIWQGHIWSAARADEGWRPYDGAGVYDPSSPTGGHYDHVHVSVTE